MNNIFFKITKGPNDMSHIVWVPLFESIHELMNNTSKTLETTQIIMKNSD